MGQQLEKNICCNQAENTAKPLIEYEEEQKQQNQFNQNSSQQQQQPFHNQLNSPNQNKLRPQKLSSNTKNLIQNPPDPNQKLPQLQQQQQQLQQQQLPNYSKEQYLVQQQNNTNNFFQQQKKYLEKNTDPYFIEQTQQKLYEKEKKSLSNIHQNHANQPLSHINDMTQTQEFLTQRINQLKDLTNHAPILQLTILSSATLQKGLVLSINCQGLINSLRQEQDGFTYFGCKKRQFRTKGNDYYEKNGFNATSTQNLNQNINENYQQYQQIVDSDDEEYSYSETTRQHQKQNQADEIINDFIIPSQDPLIADRHRGTHFQIEYNIQQNNYKIKDLGIGFGAFYKLDFPLILKNNHLINIGLIFMVINFVQPKEKYEYNQNYQMHPFFSDPEDYIDQHSDTEEEEDNESNFDNLNSNHVQKKDLKIKFFGGPCNGEKIVYRAKNNRVITVGRSKDECKPFLQDNLLSKVQCQIEYTDKIGWVLNDGKSTQGNESGSIIQQQQNSNSQSTNSNTFSQQSNRSHSTNGTWLYLGEEYAIYNGMIFKANQTLFQASII